MPRANPRTVQRKIHFYRVSAGRVSAGDPVSADLVPVLHHIDTLPFTLDGRYLECQDGTVTCCWVDRVTPSPRARLGVIRRDGLPQVERRGNLSAIPIPPEAGLAEQIHLQLFSDGILGADFNFYGPRVSRLCQYLDRRGDGLCSGLQIEHLLRQDVYEQLRRFEDILVLQLRMRPTFAAELSAIDRDLGSAFQAAARLAKDIELEIVLKPTTRRLSLPRSLLNSVRQLAGRTGIHDEASKFIIKGHLGDTRESAMLDILDDQLIAKRDIALAAGRSRALDAQAAYHPIQSAYDELRPQLQLAIGVRT